MRLKKLFFLPSIENMLFLTIFVYLSINKGMGLLGDCDTGYHIRAGEWILSHLSVPHHDMFSFRTPPLPWTAHEWLSEIIMALIHSAFGLTGLSVFFAGILALVSLLLFRMLKKEGNNILVAVFLVLLATISSQIHWLARPHVFSFLLFLLWYWILEEYRQHGTNRLYLLPPIMLLWVNLHGGFLAGFMFLAIYLAGDLPNCFSQDSEDRRIARQRLRALSITTAICVPVACINPNGFHILLFPFHLVSNKLIMDNVTEFLSPNFHEPSPFKYLILGLVAILAFSRSRLRLVEILLLLVFLNMSLYSVRYIPLFALVSAPILMRQIDLLLKESRGKFAETFTKKAANIAAIDQASGGIIWPIVAFGAVAWLVVSGTIQYGFDPKVKPVAAVNFIEKVHIPGNMFNNDEFGDYVIYAAWPRYKVFFDGRSDMYGSSRLKEYMQIMNFEEGWEKTLEKYHINWIFYNTNSQFTRYLMERKDWVLIYQDKVASIFVKNNVENRSIIETYSKKVMKQDLLSGEALKAK
ncbi:MAG: hypothetical protein WCA04_12220 [Geobacteraceae bacterium]